MSADRKKEIGKEEWVKCDQCECWSLFELETEDKKFTEGEFLCGFCAAKTINKMKVQLTEAKEKWEKDYEVLKNAIKSIEQENISRTELKVMKQTMKEEKKEQQDRKLRDIENAMECLRENILEIKGACELMMKKIDENEQVVISNKNNRTWAEIAKRKNKHGEITNSSNELWEKAHYRSTTDEALYLQVPRKEEILIKQYKEVQRMVEKRRNVLIFGVQEESDEKEKGEEILKEILKEKRSEVKVKEIKRLGKLIEGKKRPIKMEFESEEMVGKILANTKNLWKIPKYKGIYVEKDRSIEERAELKEMIEKMHEFRRQGFYSVIRNNELIKREFYKKDVHKD